MHPPVRIQPQPRRQQHHFAIGAKYGTRRTRRRHPSAHRRIEALHARRFGQVIPHRSFNAGQRVVKAGQPAIVLAQQALKKFRTFFRRNTRQFTPPRSRPRPARHYGVSLPDLEIAAKKVQPPRVCPQPGGRQAGLQRQRRFRIQLRHSQVEPAQPRIPQKRIQKISFGLFLRRHPIIGRVEHGRGSGMVIVLERLIRAQRLLQLSQRKTGIRGDEGPRRVHRLQHQFAAATAAHAEPQHLEKIAGLGRLTHVDPDDFFRPRQLLQFPRLRNVALDQLQVFSLFQLSVIVGGLIPVGDHITRQRPE